MLPLKEGEKVVIDPNFKGKLHFGPVPKTLWQIGRKGFETTEIGEIKKVQYVHNLHCNTYAVVFESTGKKEYWFKETEIC